MALKRNTAPPKGAANPKPATGTWLSRMPGRITAEDAEAEPQARRLFRDT